jgi:hypothetical protein
MVRAKDDTSAPPQPSDQVIDRRVAQRMPERVGPEVDEHVVGIQRFILTVEVVGIQPHQLGTGRSADPWWSINDYERAA